MSDSWAQPPLLTTGSAYRPDTVVDGWETDGAVVRAVSVRGRAHRASGLPRQDDLFVRAAPGGKGVIFALADGVSAASHSDVGAAAVVRYAVQWLSQSPRSAEATNWDELFASAAWALAQQAAAVSGSTEPQPDLAERDFATTLTCGFVDLIDGQLRGCVAAVGDSPVWLLKDGGFVPVVGQKQVGEDVFSSAVRALPQVPDRVAVASFELAVGEAVLVASDGIGDPLGSGGGALGAHIREAFTDGAPDPLDLAQWANFDKATFDDDRSLIAIQCASPDYLKGDIDGLEDPLRSSDVSIESI